MKNLSAYLIPTFCLLLLLACSPDRKKPEPGNTAEPISQSVPPAASPQLDSTAADELENNIVDTIFSLREVIARSKYIEQQTQGKRHLEIWIAEKPTGKTPYYWVKVGEDNGGNLVSHFDFYVYPEPMRILYYDVAEDKAMPLEDWRKQPHQ